MKVQKLRQYLGSHWKSLALYGGLFAVVSAALVWRLSSLVPGYSADEAASYQASLSPKELLDQPLNAPFYLLVKALSYAFPHTLTVTRLAAVLIGFGTLVLFAVVLRHWHERRTAVIGTLMFGLSAWFLHTARFGAPEVMLFGIFALAASGYWLKRTESKLALIVSFVLSGLLLYVPGMVWFIALGVIWQWKVIDRIFKKHLVTITLAGLAFLAALAPLGWALYKNHLLIKPWLGLPLDWPTPLQMGQNLLEVPFHLFVHGGANPATWLGTAPILDVFSLAAFVLGAYLYLRHVRLVRTSLLIAIFVLMAGLMALGSSVTFTVIIPFIYLVIAAGASYLLEQWFRVFPRNPIARVIGVTMLGLAIGLAIMFHLTHYFAGWPHAQATHDVYSLRNL